MSQQPGDLDLRMYQGATFRYVLTWLEDDVPKNLTNYTARMQARQTVTSPTTILDSTEVDLHVFPAGTSPVSPVSPCTQLWVEQVGY